jgi:predicted dehydrogenase
MKNVRIALIGSGFISHYHAKGLLQQDGVVIKAVCSLEDDIARAFADKYGIMEVTNSVLALANRDDIDAVVVSTPNSLHAPQAIEFVRNGKDVFVEKPMAVNLAECKQIIGAAEENKRLLMVGHMWRFDTEVNYIRDVIASGQLGDIFKTKGYGIHVNWGPGGWFTQKELAGGGALADMGVHAIDTVRYIIGDPEPVEVYAKIGTYFGDYDVDDTGIIMITWDNGTVSMVESGWWQPHMDGPEAATRLFGSKGYASVFPTTLKLSIGDSFGEFVPELPEREEHCDQVMYTRQMAHFVECVRNRKTPVPGWKEGQAVIEIVDAAYRSAESGKAIAL